MMGSQDAAICLNTWLVTSDYISGYSQGPAQEYYKTGTLRKLSAKNSISSAGPFTPERHIRKLKQGVIP
jgi:hypothetical protein